MRFTRWLGLLALLLAAPLTSCTDAAAMDLGSMSVELFADSIHVRVPFVIPAGADSAVVTLTLTPGGTQTRTARGQSVALVYAFAAPAEGATISLRACGHAYRGTTAGPESCNATQQWTRPFSAPGAIQWPDSMTISAMQWPDSASVALIARVMALGEPDGIAGVYDDSLLYDTTTGALATGEAWTWVDQRPAHPWRIAEPVRWATALLLRPGDGCDADCRAWLLTDTTSTPARENWRRARDAVLKALRSDTA
jgi:hypothetical protein